MATASFNYQYRPLTITNLTNSFIPYSTACLKEYWEKEKAGNLSQIDEDARNSITRAQKLLSELHF
jgi:hypothetical protein